MASTKATVTSFEQAERFLAGGRSTTSRNIANNTYVERRSEDRVAIRLHQTDVVEFTRSGLIFLNSGGWRTVTTKDRINSFLPRNLTVFSFKGVWYVSWQGQRWATKKADLAEGSVPFADNIAFREVAGQWQPIAGTFPDASGKEMIEAARKSLEKSIKAYLAKADEVLPTWTAELKENGKLNPAGDPWCCTKGIGKDENDHLWKHLQDHYVFLTLFRIALEDSGKFRDPIQRLLMELQFGWYDTLKRELRKYLLKKLDPATSVRTAQAKAEFYIDAANEVLTKPSDFGYFGSDDTLWVTSAPTFGRNRDSENVEIANFEIVWETLREEFPDLIAADPEDDDSRWNQNPGGIYIFGAGHWAVGHIDQIVVPVVKDKARPVGPSNLHPAFIRVCEFAEQTKLYPALPGAEERAAEMDRDQIAEDVNGWLDYLIERGETQLASYRDEIVGYWVVREEEYDWSADSIRQAHLDLTWDEAHAPLPGQGVLL